MFQKSITIEKLLELLRQQTFVDVYVTFSNSKMFTYMNNCLLSIRENEVSCAVKNSGMTIPKENITNLSYTEINKGDGLVIDTLYITVN